MRVHIYTFHYICNAYRSPSCPNAVSSPLTKDMATHTHQTPGSKLFITVVTATGAQSRATGHRHVKGISLASFLQADRLNAWWLPTNVLDRQDPPPRQEWKSTVLTLTESHKLPEHVNVFAPRELAVHARSSVAITV